MSKCKALFEFQGETDNELSFAAGDVIELQEEVDADWMRGRLGSKEGIFPSSFVEVVAAPEIQKTAPIKKISSQAAPSAGEDQDFCAVG